MPRGFQSIPARHSGLSLVELLISISIMAIMATLAVPSLHGLLANAHRDRALKNLVSDISLARSLAIKSARDVVICQRGGSSSCTTETLADWQVGWIVFVDKNANRERDDDEALVAERQALSGLESLRSSNSIKRLVFQPNGLLSSGMTTFEVRSTAGSHRKVILNRVGRLRVV